MTRTRQLWLSLAPGALALLLLLAVVAPAAAQPPNTIQNFRAQYDLAMADFQRVADATGDVKAAQQAAEGRAAMNALTDQQLANLFSKSRVPDFSVVSLAAGYLAARSASLSSTQSLSATQAPQAGGSLPRK